jgi:hypothetical protein
MSQVALLAIEYLTYVECGLNNQLIILGGTFGPRTISPVSAAMRPKQLLSSRPPKLVPFWQNRRRGPPC